MKNGRYYVFNELPDNLLLWGRAFVLRIYGLVLRHMFLVPRNFARWLDLFYWPLIDLLLWGYTTVYLNKSVAAGGINFVVLFIGALISWDVLFRAQQAVTVTFLEDVWSRNILNLFVSPLTPAEFLLGALAYGVIKQFITISFMALVAFWLYDYNYFSLGFYLIPAIFNLLLFGWSLGIVTTALILRFGQAAEVLAWGLAFLVQPFVGVFYPIETLPKPFMAVSVILPPTYVFNELRSIVLKKEFAADQIFYGFALNILYFVAAILFFNWLWNVVKDKGYLTRLGNE
ncbi:MAG: ABC transporter permease [Endomicrobiales bacterium]|nr:ABC transporter permease [Endomicrobiales bacterium]